MSAISLDGAALLAKVKAELAAEVEDLRSRGVTPGLGTILVGDNPSSAAYVRLKHQDCAELGITSVGEHLPADAGQDEVLATIERFNADDRVDAFLVQVPLPKGLDEEATKLGKDVTHQNHLHLLFELAEVGLQIGIVLASVSIITRRRWLLGGGGLFGIAGVVMLVVGFLA